MKHDELNNLLDSLRTPILKVTPNQKVIWLNSAAEELLSISKKRAIGKLLKEILFTHTISDTFKKVINNHETVVALAEETTLHKQKTLLLDYTFNPVISGDTLYAISIELIQSEQQTKTIRDDFLKSHHEASHESLKGLAHEIKNPLSAIKGAAQLLQHELKCDLTHHDYTDYTQLIISETDRLHALVSKMLHSTTYSQDRDVNLHEVLEYICRLIHIGKPEGISIIRDYDPSIPTIRGNQDQLKQIFFNIMCNAIEAMDEIGTLQIITRILRQTVINNICYKLVAKVDIIDNGPGISKDMINKIFFPMVSGTKNGTGMGLSIALELTSKHGATLDYLPIEKTDGTKQTCFRFLIPVE